VSKRLRGLRARAQSEPVAS